MLKVLQVASQNTCSYIMHNLVSTFGLLQSQSGLVCNTLPYTAHPYYILFNDGATLDNMTECYNHNWFQQYYVLCALTLSFMALYHCLVAVL